MRDMGEAELMRRAIEGRLLDVRTSMAATVVSFDANTMTATIRPGVRVQVVDPDTDPEVDTLRDLEDVPVMFPHMGSFLMYHPLSAGDVGRLEFSEEDDAEVYQTDSVDIPVNPTILKRHGASAVFRPEGFRGSGALGSESDAHGFLGFPGGVGVQIRSSELRLGGSDATNYVAMANLTQTLFDNLATAINGWVPVSMDGGAALKAALTAWIASSKNVAATVTKAK